MDTKKLLSDINSEVSKIVPSEVPSSITSTPIRVRKDVVSVGGGVVAKVNNGSIWRNKTFIGILAAIVCLVLIIGISVPIIMHVKNGIVSPMISLEGSTYMSLEINPKVDYVVDKEGVVKKVISKNNDGDILLSNGFEESLVGKSVDEAVKMTLDRATALGYIDAARRPDTDPNAKVNAVKISIANDDKTVADRLTHSIKEIADKHLRSKQIFMVVGVKTVDVETIKNATGIESIAKYNEDNYDKEIFHYIDNSIGKDEEALADTFQDEFLGEFVADVFEDMLEDMEDVLSIVRDIDSLMADLYEAEGILVHRDYFKYLEMIENGEVIDDQILEIISEITDKIDEFNEEITAEVDDDTTINVMAHFKPITSNVSFGIVNHIQDQYYNEQVKLGGKTGKETLENIIDKIVDDASKIDDFISIIDTVFEDIKEDCKEIIDEVKAFTDKVSMTIDEYNRVCNEKINAAYQKMLARNEGKVGSVTEEEYDALIESTLGDMDFDDFFEQNAKK